MSLVMTRSVVRLREEAHDFFYAAFVLMICFCATVHFDGRLFQALLLRCCVVTSASADDDDDDA
jgi:hypothetical protein